MIDQDGDYWARTPVTFPRLVGAWKPFLLDHDKQAAFHESLLQWAGSTFEVRGAMQRVTEVFCTRNPMSMRADHRVICQTALKPHASTDQVCALEALVAHAAVTRLICERGEAAAVVYLAETWLVPTLNDADVNAWCSAMGKPIAEHPDAREHLVATLELRDRAHFWRSPIVQGGFKQRRRVLGAWERVPQKLVGRYSHFLVCTPQAN